MFHREKSKEGRREMNIKRYLKFDVPRGPQLPNLLMIGMIVSMHQYFNKKRKE
jgi:hypothetical protein